MNQKESNQWLDLFQLFLSKADFESDVKNQDSKVMEFLSNHYSEDIANALEVVIEQSNCKDCTEVAILQMLGVIFIMAELKSRAVKLEIIPVRLESKSTTDRVTARVTTEVNELKKLFNLGGKNVI